MQEYQLDNLLVEQKNHLIAIIDNAGDDWQSFVANMGSAVVALRVLSPLWDNANYSYKRGELLERIIGTSQTMLDYYPNPRSGGHKAITTLIDTVGKIRFGGAWA